MDFERHATLLFCAKSVNVQGDRRGKKEGNEMSDFQPITKEELRELQKNSKPDDSVFVPPYEDMTPHEAAKIVEIYDRKIDKLTSDEQSQYNVAQQIADKRGVLPSDLRPGNGPFKSDEDMMKKEGVR